LKSWAFAELSPHKSSMRSPSGRAMVVIIAFIFLHVCSSAMLLWELHRREQRALAFNELQGKMADVCHE